MVKTGHWNNRGLEMTLDQFIDSREKAIRANFQSRHSIGVIVSAPRMEFFRSQKELPLDDTYLSLERLKTL
jgi:hypothetical protein